MELFQKREQIIKPMALSHGEGGGVRAPHCQQS